MCTVIDAVVSEQVRTAVTFSEGRQRLCTDHFPKLQLTFYAVAQIGAYDTEVFLAKLHCLRIPFLIFG